MKYAQIHELKVMGETVYGRDMSAKTMREFEGAETSIDKVLIIFAGCYVDENGKRVFDSPQAVEDADVSTEYMAAFTKELTDKTTNKKKR